MTVPFHREHRSFPATATIFQSLCRCRHRFGDRWGRCHAVGPCAQLWMTRAPVEVGVGRNGRNASGAVILFASRINPGTVRGVSHVKQEICDRASAPHSG